MEYGYPIRYPIPVREFCEVSAYHRLACTELHETGELVNCFYPVKLPFVEKAMSCFHFFECWKGSSRQSYKVSLSSFKILSKGHDTDTVVLT